MCNCGYCRNKHGTFEEQEARRVKLHKESMEIIKRVDMKKMFRKMRGA